MVRTWIAALATALSACAALTGAPAAAASVDTGHLQAELAPQSDGAAPGSTVYVALSQTIDKGWHTYWRNPGDSGEATKLSWTLPKGWSAGDIVWPVPQRLPLDPLMNYGYAGKVLLPAPIRVPADARPGTMARIEATADFLVCADTCVPESARLTLDIPIVAGSPAPDPRWGQAVTRTLAEAPKPAGLAGAYAVQGETLKLAAVGPALRGADLTDAYFFPFDGAAIDHAKPQRLERGPDGLTLTVMSGYLFRGGQPPAAIAGVLALKDRSMEVSFEAGKPLPPGAAGLGPPGGGRGGRAPMTLAAALGFAFLGGLILNLMPCVFPVLSMKAAALAGHAHARGAVRRQGLVFLLGVLAAFLVLAGALLALRAAGQAAGWGFQLQSPAVVAALALLMLLVALNLSGVFEVGASAQGAGSGLASRRGLVGAFFTGALAVVVAAPCTAPFMAGAMGFALTQPAPAALLVFVCLALGLAAPFTALSFAPGLLGRLPRPGPWMERLRRLLAFPMYAAAAWLAWVFSLQAGSAGLALLLAAAVSAAFAAWLYGVAQSARPGGRPALAWAAPAAAAAAAGLALLVMGVRAPPAPAKAADSGAAVAQEPFSPSRLAELRARGRPVLVNFTAAWCVTCQVNERVALSTPRVAEAFRRTGAAYLKADWTSRDPVIAAALAEQDRAGVPLYLLYGTGGRDPVILPQLLTEGGVVKALEEAAAPAA